MIVPPFYDALSWRELLAHYTAVADAISIPIMYYNLPSASGVKLSAQQLRELPVTCLKDTGGDAVAATELIQTDGPTLLNGYDTLTFAALAASRRRGSLDLPASRCTGADRRHRPAGASAGPSRVQPTGCSAPSRSLRLHTSAAVVHLTRP